MKNIEIVEWMDACSEDSWTSESDIEPSFHKILTVGMVITESEKVLTIGLNQDLTAENWSCIIHIPKVCLISRSKIGDF